MEKKIIRLPEVMAKIGLKKSAIYNMIRRGDFPQATAQACPKWATSALTFFCRH